MRSRFYKKKWHSAQEITSSFGGLSQTLNRLMILSSVWDKEAGAMGKHWQLDAVKSGTIFVKVKSSAAAQELSMRSAVFIKGLNKYFNRPWIKEIKTI